MEPFKNILVVSRSTKHCLKAVRTGISMARKFGAKLYILHVIHDPFNMDGWNLPAPTFQDEYHKMIADAKKELDRMVQAEKAEGLTVSEWVKEGEPVDEIRKVVESEHIDLSSCWPIVKAVSSTSCSAKQTRPLSANCPQRSCWSKRWPDRMGKSTKSSTAL